MGHATKTSPFAVPFPTMDPLKGVSISTLCSGVRYQGRDDMFLMRFPKGTAVAGVCTRNTVCGIPILWTRQILNRGRAQSLLVNAGYSNVFTGDEGMQTLKEAAKTLGGDIEENYIGSTGIIGQQIPREPYVLSTKKLLNASGGTFESAARAMMTTDTFAKGVTRTTKIGEKPVTIHGIAKGSGMIEPNMATMLAYVVTDAFISPRVLQALLDAYVPLSFNAITVDSDTSTSDMLLLFATGMAANEEITAVNDPSLHHFAESLKSLLIELAQLVVKDGEGITSFVTVQVTGASSDQSAMKMAKSIANSPLVKTAIAGRDANWGRLVAAAGKTGEPLNLNKTSVFFGDICVARDGTKNRGYKEDQGAAYIQQPEVTLRVDVGVGTGQATVWTIDLTHEYIAINADYRS